VVGYVLSATRARAAAMPAPRDAAAN
jgi:hypothetical protein